MCSDKISFNNRLLKEILILAKAKDLTMEYNATWTQKRKYDAYFISEKRNEKCLIEANGTQHYRETGLNNFNDALTFEEIKENDKFKYDLALLNGYQVYYINCDTNNHLEILNNMKKVLEKLIDLNNIDLLQALKNAESNTMKKVCEDYNNGLSLTQIANKYFLSMATIIRMLKIGRELNLCNYLTELEKLKINKILEPMKIKVKKHILVYTLKDIFIGEFNTIQECVDWFQINKNIIFSNTSLCRCCKKENSVYKGYKFKYKIDISIIKGGIYV